MLLHSFSAPAAFPATARRVPVIVIAGLPGAGKTSLLHHLLGQHTGRRAAVIADDELPAAGGAVAPQLFARSEEKVVRLATGAGSYELRADLLLAAGRLLREPGLDCLLVENPGLAALAPVRQTFLLGNAAYGLDLPERTRLGLLVTVVDAGRFLADLHAPCDPPPTPPLGGEAPACRADVLMEQVEQANVLIINKIDQTRAAELGRLRRLLRQLNPGARVLEARHGQLRPADLDRVDWLSGTLPAPAARLAPPAAAPGLGAWCFRDARPFHPARLWEFVRRGWPAGVLRSQGLFWLASRPEQVLRWSQAGPSRRTQRVGTWWAAVPDRDQDPGFRRDEAALRARWHPQFQDRLNTLRFVGPDLEEATLRTALESCLCTPLEIGRLRRGTVFADPWPHD